MNRPRRNKKLMYTNSLKQDYKEIQRFGNDQPTPNQLIMPYNLQKNQFRQYDYDLENWLDNRFDYQRMRTQFSKYNNGTATKAHLYQLPEEPAFDLEESSVASPTDYCPSIPPTNSECQIQIESDFRSSHSHTGIDIEGQSEQLYYVSGRKNLSKEIDVETQADSREKGKLSSLIFQQMQYQNKGKTRSTVTVKKQKLQSDKTKTLWEIPDDLCIKLDQD